MSSLIHKLKTASRLSTQQWLLFIQSWFLMLYIRLRMDLTPFKSWKHWLINQSTGGYESLSQTEQKIIIQTRRMIVLASRYHIINANCLPKSLALKWLLDQHSIACELKMGLSLDKPDFKGHAWLVHGDIVLNDSTDVAQQYPVEQKINQPPLIN